MSRVDKRVPFICRVKRKLGLDGWSLSAMYFCAWLFRHRPTNKCKTCPKRVKTFGERGIEQY